MIPRHHSVDMGSTNEQQSRDTNDLLGHQNYDYKTITFKRALLAFILFTSITHLASLIKVYSWADYLQPIEFKENVRQDSLMMKRLRSYDEPEWRLKRIEGQLKILNPVVPGWGENGYGVSILDPEQSIQVKRQYHKTQNNNYVAERISMNRTLQRYANMLCYNTTYDIDELPTVSIVIISHNEVFPVLMRTLWSVITRSPKKLLREIILVDDDSTWPEYQSTFLDDYIRFVLNSVPRHERFFNPEAGPLVKLIRLGSREGLIRARLAGARRAKGEVLQFLDAHVETTDLWLEPILQRIMENRKVFVIPMLDDIKSLTLQYKHHGDRYRNFTAGFSWTGIFSWEIRDKRELESTSPDKPLSSGTMQGGLFGVDRKYFWEIGGYDEAMRIWGGENMEMSFRVWQCGGRVEMHPCSRVGHFSRTTAMYMEDYSFGYNWHRTAAVWMPPYVDLVRLYSPLLRILPPGDIRERLELKKRLKCRDFDWYLKEAYKGKKFIHNKNVRGYGTLSNPITNLCVDTLQQPEGHNIPVGLRQCRPRKSQFITTQDWSYMKETNLIERDKICLVNGHVKKLYGIRVNYSDVQTTTNSQKWMQSLPREDLEELPFYELAFLNQFKLGYYDFNQTIYPKVENIFTGESRYIVSMIDCSIVEFYPSTKKAYIWHRKLVNNTVDLYLISNEISKLCMTTKVLTLNGPKPGQKHLLVVDTCNMSDPHQYWKFQHDLENPHNLGDNMVQ